MSGTPARGRRLASCIVFKSILFSTALLGTVALASDDSRAERENDADHHAMGRPLQILWTNDTHGFFLPVYHAEYTEIDSYAGIAATEGKVGGYAQIAGLVKKLKEDQWEHRTLFVDSGDTFDGSPVAQNSKGQALIPILNAMGYDAWTPGNRDFAWPKPDFLAVTSQLTFPMVCANLQDATTGSYVFPRYIVKRVGGLKVALIGLTSTAGGGAGFQLLGGNIPASFAIEDDISALAAEIRTQEDPDLVVVLSHMGFYQDQKFASRSTGIDVIVGAHTHHNVKTAPVVANLDGSRNVLVVQAGSHGKYLGQLQLWIKDHKVVRYHNELIRVSTENLRKLHAKPDPLVESLANLAYAPYQAMFDRVIGNTATLLERRGDTQSTMTNLLNDAVAERYGVDGARFPGIRYGASLLPGPITVGDVWNIVSPNLGGNRMYTYTQTGAQIYGVLNGGLNTEYGPDPYNWNGGDVTRFNGRVKYTYKVNTPPNQHIVDLSITTASGEVVNLVQGGVTVPANMGRVFTFAGSFSLGAPATPIAGVTAVDEIVDYIQGKGTVAPVIDDRTVQLDSAPSNISDIE